MIGRWFKTAEKSRDQAGPSRLRHWMFSIVTLLIVGGVGGVLVSASGVIPIKASSGHWAITRWFLQFSKQQSVSTHTLGLRAPPLDEPWLVLKGAGHYEIGCRPCHGSPELEHPRIAQHMQPVPPYLPRTISNWKPQELFYMVKHGIKFTGMPAWPSQQRDDEVWAMVAFLLAFPELDAKKYRQLVNGDAAASDEDESAPLTALEPEAASASLTKSCVPCHGADGNGRENGAFPKLSGQRSEYFTATLKAYARGERHSGIMEPIAAGLGSEQIRELASHYEGLKSRPSPPSRQSAQSIERGQAIAQRGIPNQDVPACAGCHGPSETPRNPNYPLLAGQYADYLGLQLTLFKQEQRGGTAYAHLMRRVAVGMNSEQMRDVASYYASLPSSQRVDRK